MTGAFERTESDLGGAAAPAPPGMPSLWSLALSSFLPAMIYEIGTGAITPVIVITAKDLDASTGMAAFVVSLLGLGRVIGDVPAAVVADRLGDRRSMILAALLALLAFFACMVSPSLIVFCVALLLLGMTSSTFYLARMSYLIEVAPVRLRARAQSTLAGSHRIGLFIGPFLGALAISIGGVRAVYVVAMCTAVVTAILLFVVSDVEMPPEQQTRSVAGVTAGRVFRNQRELFLTLGVAVALVGAVRQARQTVLPLWSQHIGLSPTQISLAFGFASAVDMVLFYPSGKMMDRWGRLAVAVPAMAIMGLGLIALPLTHDLLTLTIVAMVVSFGNGLGSGIIQTIGADAAPLEGRRQFLSIWRLSSDSGQALGPVVVSIITAVATLAAAVVTLGGVGLLAGAGLARWVPRYSPFATPKSTRAHREREVVAPGK